MITFKEENRKQILKIVSNISSTENIDKIKPLVKELQSLTKGYLFCLLDFYIPELKICIEFDGDLCHANPNKFKASDKPSPFSDKTAQEIWSHDKQRQEFIESQGIKVVRIWESEYKSKKFDINEFITKLMGIELANSQN